LGPYRLHLFGIRSQHPDRDDPLRHDQDRAACDRPPARAIDQRRGRHGQLRAARADYVGGGGAFVKDLAKQNGQSVDDAASSFVKQHRPTSLLQRLASTEEIANLVVYVCSKQASATNGAALRAEGGIVNTIA